MSHLHLSLTLYICICVNVYGVYGTPHTRIYSLYSGKPNLFYFLRTAASLSHAPFVSLLCPSLFQGDPLVIISSLQPGDRQLYVHVQCTHTHTYIHIRIFHSRALIGLRQLVFRLRSLLLRTSLSMHNNNPVQKSYTIITFHSVVVFPAFIRLGFYPRSMNYYIRCSFVAPYHTCVRVCVCLVLSHPFCLSLKK